MNICEIKIPVPWGHVAAKSWGNINDPIVLVVHGLLDNAGSFDRLIPLLPKSFCYICIDLPGHGKSSHLPSVLPIYTINYVMVLKLIMQHFKRKEYIILAHSYGGFLTFLFAQIYPEYVEKLIFLDMIHLFIVETRHFKSHLKDRFDYCITLEEKFNNRSTKRPSYTYEEALDKIQNQRLPGLVITREAAKPLLERAITPVDDEKYSFTSDPRVKAAISPLHDFTYILDIIKKNHIVCPVLIINAKEAPTQRKHRQTLRTFFKDYSNFSFVDVDGNHDVHNNNPENVASHVATFLLAQNSKL